MSTTSAWPVLAARAPAKVNLSLHVLGRRPDGYHNLESLVVFAGTGDSLSLTPGDGLSLAVRGPRAGEAGEDGDNLVLKAARALRDRRPGLRMGRFDLVKRLPVAAGLGGGSSDAAAALRLLARLNGIRLHDPLLHEAARATGSDVPVCLVPVARMMAGAGERLGRPLRLPPLFALLVNPGAPVPTPAVFAGLSLAPGDASGLSAHPRVGDVPLIDLVGAARNDLEPAARAVAPVIGEVLEMLRATSGARLARMSGSGATCFALYDDCAAAARAGEVLRRARPLWWIKPTRLR